MTDYPFGIQLAVAPLDENNIIRDGEIWIYAPTDTAGVSPLELTDLSGLPMVNPLRSNGFGYTRPFIANIPQVKWKSGIHEGLFDSFTGMRDEAVSAVSAASAAQTAAETASADASTAAGNALATAAVDATGALILTKASGDIVNAGSVKGAKGDKGDKGDKGLDGSNILPTDDAIEQAVKTPGTKTATALTATYASKADLANVKTVVPAYAVALGDSQTAGTLTPGLAYPNLVAALVDRRLGVVNKGVGGNTTQDMLNRLSTDVLALNPKICIFQGGTNDIAGSVPLATTQANIKSIAQQVTAAGIEFIINTIPPRNQHGALGAGKVRDLNNWIRLWGAASGYRVVDINPLLTNPKSGEYAAGLNVDAVHPSAAGIMIMAQAVSQVLIGNQKASLVPSVAPTECEVDYLATSAVQSAQLVNNPLMYSTISDGANYPNRPDTWFSDGVAGVAVGSSSGATTIQITDPLAPGSYIFSTGQVQAETRTITSVTGSSAPYTATVSAAFSNPHPAAHYIDRAAAPYTLVDDPRFTGKVAKIVGNNQAAPHNSWVVLPSAAWAVGDKIRLVGKVALDSPTSIPSGKGVEISINFAGAGTSVKAVTQMNWATPMGLALTFAVDATVPAGTTAITVQHTLDVGSGSGTAYFGQIGALNLKTLAVDTIALPA